MDLETREAYIKKMHEKLSEWNVELEKFKVKADASMGTMREEYYKTLNDLRLRKETLQNKLSRIQGSSSESWSELKEGTERALIEFRDAIKKAFSNIKE